MAGALTAAGRGFLEPAAGREPLTMTRTNDMRKQRKLHLNWELTKKRKRPVFDRLNRGLSERCGLTVYDTEMEDAEVLFYVKETGEYCAETEIACPFNKAMSEKYGLHIRDSKNPQFPFFVREWGECFTEEEIRKNIPDWRMIQGIQLQND